MPLAQAQPAPAAINTGAILQTRFLKGSAVHLQSLLSASGVKTAPCADAMAAQRAFPEGLGPAGRKAEAWSTPAHALDLPACSAFARCHGQKRHGQRPEGCALQDAAAGKGSLPHGQDRVPEKTRLITNAACARCCRHCFWPCWRFWRRLPFCHCQYWHRQWCHRCQPNGPCCLGHFWCF